MKAARRVTTGGIETECEEVWSGRRTQYFPGV